MTQFKKNLVIGYPLEHSQSPYLHNAVYEKLNITHTLECFSHPCIHHLISYIKAESIELTAVTMPHKKNVLETVDLDKQSLEVISLGAANTLIQREGQLHAYNTDVDGIAYALRNTQLLGRNILIIGSGGAARAAGYFLQKASGNLYWLNRTPEKACILADHFGGTVVKFNEVNNLIIDVIINTTPVGMFPLPDDSPLPNFRFRSHQTVFDMVYNPLRTQLLKTAHLDGAKIISGQDMFLAQGIHQIALWIDKTLPIEALITKLKIDLSQGEIK